MKTQDAHVICSVVDSQHQGTRDQWIKFIFNDTVAATLFPGLRVCAKHFKPECFANLGQKAKKPPLERGAFPTITYNKQQLTANGAIGKGAAKHAGMFSTVFEIL